MKKTRNRQTETKKKVTSCKMDRRDLLSLTYQLFR